jgi:hypothetical protein
MLVIPECRRLRQEYHKFVASLGSIVRVSQKKKKLSDENILYLFYGHIA